MGSVTGIQKIAARKAGVTLAVWLRKRAAGFKWCYLCRKWKRLGKFGFDLSRTDKRKSACFPCASIKSIASRFGVSAVSIAELRANRPACQICGRKRLLVVDHDHVTGSIRGILCARCNLGIGYFVDNPQLLKNAASYLEGKNGENIN